MKRLWGRIRNESATTLAEMSVSIGVLGLLGVVFFAVLNSGMILFAKNSAVNTAHQQGRDGINRLTRDIHASISVPELRDSNFNTVSSTPATGAGSAPMAAGVSFQNIALGPQYVWKDSGNANMIMVKGTPDSPECPSLGMRLISPLFGVEDTVIKVTSTPTQSGHHNVFLASGQEVAIANKATAWGTTGNTYSVIYYTYRVMYLVRNGKYILDSNGPFRLTVTAASSSDQERFALSGTTYIPSATGPYKIVPSASPGSGARYRYEDGELHFYRQTYANNSTSWSDVAVVARFISSPTPFYVPLSSSSTGPWYESTNSYLCYTTSSSDSTGRRFASSADTRYVGIKLTARDPGTSNRAYQGTATLLNTQVDYRARLALYQ